MNDFKLDSRLQNDSSFVTTLSLCEVRLHHNAEFPWILLIPRRPNVSEIIDLGVLDQRVLMEEIVVASHVMQQIFRPAKLNVASLGNMVPQLHVHIIARYTSDKAWPHPVWNGGAGSTYSPEKKIEILAKLEEAFTSSAQSESSRNP